ncbi:alpha/beta-hydrolase [Trametopsis cervina]|nr:alpha/beta-hydrolase [Trametopsis cervina]
MAERNSISDEQYRLLEANRDAIESVTRRTHVYGATDRHQLDVYIPPNNLNASSQDLPPVLVFFYGGGFTHGSRVWVPDHSLVHANMGAYFATKGIVAVIPDYRLVPTVTYPGGTEDIRNAIDWVIQNLANVANCERVFLMAHSAGGIHLSSFLLSPLYFDAQPTHRTGIRGAILVGVPYEIPVGNKVAANMHNAAQLYYCGVDNIAKQQPMGLLRRAEETWVTGLPPIRILVAARDPRHLVSSAKTFSNLWEKKGGRVSSGTLDGHDHLSPIFSPFSGQREEWANDVINWIFATE